MRSAMGRFLLFLATLVALSAIPLCGQTFGEITGKITDPSGAIVPGATVTEIGRASCRERVYVLV